MTRSLKRRRRKTPRKQEEVVHDLPNPAGPQGWRTWMQQDGDATLFVARLGATDIEGAKALLGDELSASDVLELSTLLARRFQSRLYPSWHEVNFAAHVFPHALWTLTCELLERHVDPKTIDMVAFNLSLDKVWPPIRSLPNAWSKDLSQLAHRAPWGAIMRSAVFEADDSLEWVEHLSALESLEIVGTGFRDLKRLTCIATLRDLDLSGNEISDLTPLSGARELRELTLSDNQIGDITPLSHLKNLRELYLDQTLVCDVTPLASLEHLHTLSVSNTFVSDVAPLASMPRLKNLFVYGSSVVDLSPVRHLVDPVSDAS